MKTRLRIETLEQRELLTASALDAFPQGYQSQFFNLVSTQDHAYFQHLDEDSSFTTWRLDKGTTSAERHPTQIGNMHEVGGGKAFFFTSYNREAETIELYAQYDDEASPKLLDAFPTSDEERFAVSSVTAYRDGVAFTNPYSSEIFFVNGENGAELLYDASEMFVTQGISYSQIELTDVGDSLLVRYLAEPTAIWKLDGEQHVLLYKFGDRDYNDVEVRTFDDVHLARVTGQFGSQIWRLDLDDDQFVLEAEWPGQTVSWNDISYTDRSVFFTVSRDVVSSGSREQLPEFLNDELWRRDANGQYAQLPIDAQRGMIVDTAAIDDSVLYVQLAEDGNYDLWHHSIEAEQRSHVHEFSRIVRQSDNTLVTNGSGVFFVDGNDIPLRQDALFTYDLTSGKQPVATFERGISTSLESFHDQLIFAADDGDGFAFWSSLGTPASTTVLARVNLPAENPFNAWQMDALDDQLLFNVYDRYGSSVIWTADQAGEFEAVFEASGSARIMSQDGQEILNQGIFGNHDGQWRTDGTRSGTELLSFSGVNLNGEPNSTTGSGLLWPVEPKTIGDTTYFTASTDEHGAELWASRDGDQWMVRDILPGEFGSHPQNLAAIDGILYFSARDRTTIYRFGDIEEEHEENWEFWRSDGTFEGTYKVAELNPDPEAFPASTSSSDPRGFKPVESGFIFQATFDGFARYRRGEVSSGWFISDGTGPGTYRIEALDGATPLDIADKEPLFLTETGIWTTDGIEDGTVPVTGFDAVEGQPVLLRRNSGISFGSPSTTVAPEFEYIAFYADSETQVWRTDGSAPGTVHLLTIPQAAKVVKLLDENSTDVLIGFESTDDSQLWFVGEEGSELIREFAPQTTLSGNGWSLQLLWESGDPLAIYRRLDTGSVDVRKEGVLAFDTQAGSGDDFESRQWRTDGTVENTYAVEKVTTVWDYIAYDGRVFFKEEHPDYGVALWETDGTEEGTFVYDLFPGPDEHGFPDEFEIYNDQVYFIAQNQLWKIGDENLRGDLNGDLIVDFADFLAVSHNFGKESDEGDVDGNGQVDFADFLEVSHSFGRKEFETLRTVEPIQAKLEHVDLIFEAAILASN